MNIKNSISEQIKLCEWFVYVVGMHYDYTIRKFIISSLNKIICSNTIRVLINTKRNDE